MVEVGKTEDVAKHEAVGINPGRVLFEINSAQIFGAKFLAKRIGDLFCHLPFQNDVASIGMKFFRNFGARKLQLLTDKIDSRVDLGQATGIGYDGFDRNVMSEDFVVRVENRPALGGDRLLDDVVFSSAS